MNLKTLENYIFFQIQDGRLPLFFKNCHICTKVKALAMKLGRMILHPILNPIWHMKI